MLEQVAKELARLYRETPKHAESILGSMTTPPDPLALFAFLAFAHTNASDDVLFPPLRKMKTEILEFARAVFGARAGFVTAGGTESNIMAIYIARNICKGSNVVLAPDTAHVSIDKACKILGCKLVKVPARNKPVDPDLLKKFVELYRPFGVVITVGTTELGLADPVKDVAQLAASEHFYLHVDAALGGLVAPFLHERGLSGREPFFYPGVSSISVDFHKFGASPIPSGLLLFESEELADRGCFEQEYTLSGTTCGLLGTRPGGSVAAMWAIVKAYGVEGLRARAVRARELAKKLYIELASVSDVEAFEPMLITVAFKHKRYRMGELVEALAKRGLYLYKAPSIDGARVVVMPHVDETLLKKLLDALKSI